MAGGGSAPAGGVTIHSREASGTALGILRSLREELAGNGRRLQPAPRPDDAERPASEPSDAGQRIGGDPRRTASEGSRHRPALGPISAARSEKTPMSGAPRGARKVAQSFRAASWLNGCGYD